MASIAGQEFQQGRASKAQDEKKEQVEMSEGEGKEIASSDSTNSSEGKGSGGGYSADHSDQDQSSDDAGAVKTGTALMAASVAGLRISEGKGTSGVAKRTDEVDSNSSSSLEDIHGKSKREGKGSAKQKSSRSKTKQNLDLEMEVAAGTLLKSILNPTLSQLSGVWIHHPMDPRIDLSHVGHATNVEIGGLSQLPIPGCQEGTKQGYQDVRPFFHAQGVEVPNASTPQKDGNGNSSDPVSSEGFTSFFTTTTNNTGSSNTAHTQSADSSDSTKKIPAKKDATEQNHSDGSSMVVLARVKKKHKRKNGDGGGDSSGSSSDKRVRILDNKESNVHEMDNELAGEVDNVDVSNQEQHPDERIVHARHGANDSTTSSSSQNDEDVRRTARLVTDISSSARTDSAHGTSESNGNTASGSNQGSSASGSGMDGKGSSEEGKGSSEEGKGSSEEGKGSSEDLPKGESAEPVGGPVGNAKDSTTSNPVVMPNTKENESAVMEGSQRADVTEKREKLINKKRKRIEMRREYEAQQHFESSESSHAQVEARFRPGKAVHLDQVLQCSQVPRLVVQAVPPFLAIHANAAYTRLTGIEAHQAVGKPIGTLLTIPESTGDVTRSEERRREEVPDPGVEQPLLQTDGDMAGAVAAGAGRARAESQRQDTPRVEKLERLILSCGFGHVQFVNAVARPHQLLGCNVSFPSLTGSDAQVKDEGSNGTSLSSMDIAQSHLIPCRTAIAPIISSHVLTASAGSNETLETSKPPPDNAPAKRRKQQDGDISKGGSLPAFRHNHRQIITHYVIQLESQNSPGIKHFSVDDSISSRSSTVEARDKSDLSSRQDRVPEESPRGRPGILADDEASETTGTREAVAAIG